MNLVDELRVSKLEASANDGRLEGGGTISLAGYAPDRLDLRLALDRWPAIATHRYRSDMSGEIHCRGTMAAPDVSGKMEVLWGIFRPDLASELSTKQPHSGEPVRERVDASFGIETGLEQAGAHSDDFRASSSRFSAKRAVSSGSYARPRSRLMLEADMPLVGSGSSMPMVSSGRRQAAVSAPVPYSPPVSSSGTNRRSTRPCSCTPLQSPL